MRKIIKNLFSIGVLILLLVPNVGIAKDRECYTSKNVLVKMGGHVFSIPKVHNGKRVFNGIYLENNGRSIEECYKDEDPPIEVNYFGFYPYMAYGGLSYTIRLYSSEYYSNKNIEIPDTTNFQKDEKRNLYKKISDSPSEGTTFISYDEKIKTLGGDRVVFSCTEGKNNSLNKKEFEPENILLCSSGFMWKDGIWVDMRQNTGDFNLDYWKEIFSSLYNYIEKLEVTNKTEE